MDPGRHEGLCDLVLFHGLALGTGGQVPRALLVLVLWT
jgi:hypothetical protein